MTQYQVHRRSNLIVIEGGGGMDRYKLSREAPKIFLNFDDLRLLLMTSKT